MEYQNKPQLLDYLHELKILKKEIITGMIQFRY